MSLINKVTSEGSSSAAIEEFTPTYQNGWVDLGGDYSVSIKKVNGVVYMQGLVKNGFIPSTVFVLPEGFRPSAIQVVNACCAAQTATRLDIRHDGVVTIEAGGATVWTSIACSFVAA